MGALGDDAEKPPAAVAVRVVRSAKVDARRGDGGGPRKGPINVMYGMRSKKILQRKSTPGASGSKGRDQSDVKPIRLADQVATLFGKAFAAGQTSSANNFGLYKQYWGQINFEMDQVMRGFQKPVHEKTVAAIAQIEEDPKIPNLVPAVLHEATGISPLDYSAFFSHMLAQLRGSGRYAIELKPDSMFSIRRFGILSSIHTLLVDQNKAQCSRDRIFRVNGPTAARQSLEDLHSSSGRHIVLAVENPERVDSDIWNEFVLALSELWRTVPAVLVIGRLTKREFTFSNTVTRALSKLSPTTVEIPSQGELLERMVEELFMKKKPSLPAIGPKAIDSLFDTLLHHHTSIDFLRRFLKTVIFQHFIHTPACALCMAEGPVEEQDEVDTLAGLLGCKRGSGASVSQALRKEREKLSQSMQKFAAVMHLTKVCMVAAPGRKMLLRLLQDGSMSMKGSEAKALLWAPGSALCKLKQELLSSDGEHALQLRESWQALLEDMIGDPGMNGVCGFLRGLQSELQASSSDDRTLLALPAPETSTPTPSPEERRPAAPRGRRSRKESLQQHMSTLARSSGGEVSERAERSAGVNLAETCASFLITIWDKMCEESIDDNRLQSTLVIDDSYESTADIVAPSISSKVSSSLQDPALHMKGLPGKEASKDMEDSCLVFQLLQNQPSNVVLDDVYQEYAAHIQGSPLRASKGPKRRGRKRKLQAAPEGEGSDAAAAAEHGGSAEGGAEGALRSRFERAVQELKLCGLVRITKKKLSKHVALTFT